MSLKLAGLLKTLQLRPVKSMKFTFDPYQPNVRSIREVLFHVNTPRIRDTNLSCTSKVDIRSDGAPPQIQFNFIDDQTLIFKTQHLTSKEMLDRIIDICIAKDPKKDKDSQVLSKGPGKAKLRKK